MSCCSCNCLRPFGQWELPDEVYTAAEQAFIEGGSEAALDAAELGLDAAIESGPSFWDSWMGNFIETAVPKLAVAAGAAALSASLAPKPQVSGGGTLINPYGFGPSSSQFYRVQPQQPTLGTPTAGVLPPQQSSAQPSSPGTGGAPTAATPRWALPAAVGGIGLLLLLVVRD